MNVKNAQYKEHTIRYLELPDNELLLNTKDVLTVLGISERQQGSDLAESCLDLTSAVTAAARNSDDFVMWLNETFSGYNLQTLLRPKYDDEWNFS